MDTQSLQLFAGITSTVMFLVRSLPMLFKAFKTKDLKSYSFANILLSNLGNLVHWLYDSSRPVGPIWFLHGFFTAANAVMLCWCLRYELGWRLA
jgi:uncharacterized protein with PQ loop repeat